MADVVTNIIDYATQILGLLTTAPLNIYFGCGVVAAVVGVVATLKFAAH